MGSCSSLIQPSTSQCRLGPLSQPAAWSLPLSRLLARELLGPCHVAHVRCCLICSSHCSQHPETCHFTPVWSRKCVKHYFRLKAPMLCGLGPFSQCSRQLFDCCARSFIAWEHEPAHFAACLSRANVATVSSSQLLHGHGDSSYPHMPPFKRTFNTAPYCTKSCRPWHEITSFSSRMAAKVS